MCTRVCVLFIPFLPSAAAVGNIVGAFAIPLLANISRIVSM